MQQNYIKGRNQKLRVIQDMNEIREQQGKVSLNENPLHKKIVCRLDNRGLLIYSENYYSPTDNMLSPCTAKLQAYKKKNNYNRYWIIYIF
jgi:hypothetical protein